MTLDDLEQQLKAPFTEDEIQYRLGNTWDQDGARWGRPLAFIDARVVMERLDRVARPSGWEKRIRPTLVAGAYTCALTILGVTKEANGQAGQDEGEKEKSGESDALKRAAVCFGIGRYLYDIDIPPVQVKKKGNGWELPKHYQPPPPVKARLVAPRSAPQPRDLPTAIPTTTAPALVAPPLPGAGTGLEPLTDEQRAYLLDLAASKGLDEHRLVALAKGRYREASIEAIADLKRAHYLNLTTKVLPNMAAAKTA